MLLEGKVKINSDQLLLSRTEQSSCPLLQKVTSTLLLRVLLLNYDVFPETLNFKSVSRNFKLLSLMYSVESVYQTVPQGLIASTVN